MLENALRVFYIYEAIFEIRYLLSDVWLDMENHFNKNIFEQFVCADGENSFIKLALEKIW